jgi:6-phosphogluconate dehydrogenase (decarboxylating)
MMKTIKQENARLGFVGIGYMGRPIARRLLESGFKLTAYDRDQSKAEELVRYGGSVAPSVSELSSSCDIRKLRRNFLDWAQSAESRSWM